MPDIFDEAKAVRADRRDTHGKPENSFPAIADFWTTYLRCKHGVDIKLTPYDAAVMLGLFKEARAAIQPEHRDNHRDAINYFAIAADELTQERKGHSCQSNPSPKKSLNCYLLNARGSRLAMVSAWRHGIRNGLIALKKTALSYTGSNRRSLNNASPQL